VETKIYLMNLSGRSAIPASGAKAQFFLAL
jgi:hypothetical protein